MTRKDLKQLLAEWEEMKQDTAFGILTKPGLIIESRKVTNAVAILFMDIDNVHLLNEQFGEYETVNAMMTRALKIRHDDLLLTGRWFSGDEIVLIVKGDPAGVAARLQESLNRNGLSATIAYAPLNSQLEQAVALAAAEVAKAKKSNQRGKIIAVK